MLFVEMNFGIVLLGLNGKVKAFFGHCCDQLLFYNSLSIEVRQIISEGCWRWLRGTLIHAAYASDEGYFLLQKRES